MITLIIDPTCSHIWSIRAKIENGEFKVTADDWPAFMYESGVYDPDELDKGLLRGTYLLRVRDVYIPESLLIPFTGFQAHFYWAINSLTGRQLQLSINTRLECEAPWNGSRNTRINCICRRSGMLGCMT